MVQYALNTHASVKIVTVNAGAERSLRYHHQRAELWVTLDDGLVVEIDGTAREVKAGDEIWIAVGSTHRVAAPGAGGRFIKGFSFGHFSEADVTRLEGACRRAFLSGARARPGDAKGAPPDHANAVKGHPRRNPRKGGGTLHSHCHPNMPGHVHDAWKRG
jgi:mannose-6-phosphate isomerase-like protein (cupin superfamily)